MTIFGKIMDHRRNRTITQSGFTLVEVLLAGVVTGFLGLMIWQALLEINSMVQLFSYRFILNGEARHIFFLLGFGGGAEFNGQSGIQNDEKIVGYTGKDSSPYPGYIFVQEGLLNLKHDSVNIILKQGQVSLPYTIPCRGVSRPNQDCLSSGEATESMGYIVDYQVSPGADGRMDHEEIMFDLFHPNLGISREISETQISLYAEHYWTLFSLDLAN